MVSPKFCWSCGRPIQPNQRFCEVCGADLQLPSDKAKDAGDSASLNSDLNGQGIQDGTSEGLIAQQVNSSITQPSGAIPYQGAPAGSLFDPQREFYVMNEKFWHWGSGDILDESGMPIGKMHRIFLSLRAKIELQEVSGEIGAEIHRKIFAVRPTYDLKDPDGNQIGRLRKAILNVIHPKIWLEDPAGNKILEARGS
ncbi:MAG TPA: zinc-ribbon domain-containing protein, partial [Candidatus Lokiarchaeia archaeon]|nr:zinc-ribbon domain-containing protein [Candidatus Lokiarchaeia archaeon]